MPGAQKLHFAVFAPEKDPKEQLAQLDPDASLYVPALQLKHVLLPELLWKVPAIHLVHAGALLEAANIPDMQLAHAFEPFASLK